MRISSLIAALALGVAALPAKAYEPDLSLPAGTEIVVDTFDTKTGTFAVYAAKVPCEGLSYVLPDALRAAVPALKPDQPPESLLGKSLTTSAELRTVADDAVVANHDAMADASALAKLCAD